MNISEIEPIVDKVCLPYEFYNNYFKRMEIKMNGILLGLIDNSIDIHRYHEFYQDLQTQKNNKSSKIYKSAAQGLINLLKDHEIVIYSFTHGNLFDLPVWRIFKDHRLIAESKDAET